MVFELQYYILWVQRKSTIGCYLLYVITNKLIHIIKNFAPVYLVFLAFVFYYLVILASIINSEENICKSIDIENETLISLIRDLQIMQELK